MNPVYNRSINPIKIFLFAISAALLFSLQSFNPDKSPCTSNKQTFQLNNFNAYGDQLLNFQSSNSLTDMAERGYTITLSFKADDECTYSKSQEYTNNDPNLANDSFYEAQVPVTFNYKTTIKIVSNCVNDYYLGMNVKFTWSKTFNSTDFGVDHDLEFPVKSICSSSMSVIERDDIIEAHAAEDRIASSATRLTEK